MKRSLLVVLLTLALVGFELQAQDIPVNYDEAKIPAYTLPDPLLDPSGKKVTTKDQWINYQRPRMLQLYKEHVYGKFPASSAGVYFKSLAGEYPVFNGKATCKQVRITISNKDTTSYIDL